jgi:hypothetical protein
MYYHRIILSWSWLRKSLLQESWRGEEAGRQLVLALCENLRCGSQVLEQALLSYHAELGYQAALWNRNRRNRNFLASGTGTGTGSPELKP